MRSKLKVTLTILISAMFLAACMEESTSDRQEADRSNIMDRAYEQIPTPQLQNFVKRRAVSEYMERMDEPNKTFYIYVIADTGNVMGYYVSRGGPINICTFMTPPDRVSYERSQGRVVREAPGIDGLYYGGDGACDTEYFFDAETDAMIQLNGLNLFVADQPLDIEANPINVKTQE